MEGEPNSEFPPIQSEQSAEPTQPLGGNVSDEPHNKKTLKVALFIVIPVVILLIISAYFLFFNQEKNAEISENGNEIGGNENAQAGSEPSNDQNGIGKYEWIKFSIIPESPPANIIFDIKFNSEEGAKGLLTGYYDNEELGFVDEKIWINIQEFGSETSLLLPGPLYSGQLLEDYSPSLHTFSFRLDDFSDIKSQATISNIQIGLINIEEYNRQIENQELDFDTMIEYVDFNEVITNSHSNRPEYQNLDSVSSIILEAGPE